MRDSAIATGCYYRGFDGKRKVFSVLSSPISGDIHTLNSFIDDDKHQVAVWSSNLISRPSKKRWTSPEMDKMTLAVIALSLVLILFAFNTHLLDVEGNLMNLSRLSVGRWPNPVIIIGLPKAGTTSIQEFFQCANLHIANAVNTGKNSTPTPLLRISHWECQHGKYCGKLIQQNMMHQDASPISPLHNTGDYDVYAQIDVEGDVRRNKACYLPQISALPELFHHHPRSTFILNIRNVDSWIRSIRSWSRMDTRLYLCDLPGLPPPSRVTRRRRQHHPRRNRDPRKYRPTDDQLRTFYEMHLERVRNFAFEHPSFQLVELNIDSDAAGKVMEDAFGVDRSCWGHYNEQTTK